MISRSAKYDLRVEAPGSASISRWITFETDLTTQRAGSRNKFSGRTAVACGVDSGAQYRGGISRGEEREREREREANDEDARIRTCAQRALPPFVEKGRRSYVVAQLMRPPGTIIW